MKEENKKKKEEEEESIPPELEKIIQRFGINLREQAKEFEDKNKRDKLKNEVIRYYPTPMALLIQRFIEFSFGKRIERPLETCNVMLDLFILSVEFFSFVGLVSYSEYPDLHTDSASSRIAFLRDEPKIYIGNWWELLREITRCFVRDRQKCIMPELIDFYWKKGGKVQRYINILDMVPSVRNKIFGHGMGLSENVAKGVIIGFRNYVLFLISQWNFLEYYYLFTPTEEKMIENQKYVNEVICFRGNQGQTQDLLSVEPLKKNHLYLIKPKSNNCFADDEYILQPGEAIQLSPLFLFDEQIFYQEPTKLYLQFQSAKKKQKSSDPDFEYVEYKTRNLQGPFGKEFQFREELDDASKELYRELYEIFSKALIHGAEALISKKTESKKKPDSKDKLDWSIFLDICKDNSERFLADIRGRKKYIKEIYINRSETEQAFNRFCKSEKSGFVLVGASGMGKTNLLCHLYDQLTNEGHAMLFINSAQIDRSLNLEESITKEIYADPAPFNKICEDINSLCQQQSKYFVVLIDAINEYMHHDAGPSDLAIKIDDIIARNKHSNIKFVMTSRIKIWQTIKNSYNVTLSEAFYYKYKESPKGELAFTINRFDKDELEKAFDKYASYYKIDNTYEELPKIIQYELSDPLMLRFVCEVYSGHAIPIDIHPRNIFEKYFSHFVYDEENDEGDVTLRMLIYRVVNYMHSLKKDNFYVYNDLEKDVTDSGQKDYKALLAEVLDTKIGSTYITLVDNGILNETHLNNDRMIRFTYDRFFEYVLSNIFMSRLGQIFDTEQRWPLKRNGMVEFIVKQVEQSEEFNTLWGALVKAVVSIQEGKIQRVTSKGKTAVSERQFLDIIKVLSEHDINVLILLGAVLEDIALSKISIFDRICKELRKKESESALEMLIDSTFYIISSERFRLFYKDQDRQKQIQLNQIFYENFAYGIKQDPGRIADKAIQYIYFLWWVGYSDHQKWCFYKQYAESILENLVNRISAGKMINSETRNTLLHVLGLLLLLVAEKSDEHDQIYPILNSAKKLVHSLHIDFLEKMIVFMMKSILTILPNPINMQELQSLFSDQQTKSQGQRLLELLDPTSNPLHEASEEEVLEIASQSNSFIYSLMSFALSSQYSIYYKSHGQQYFHLLEHLFNNGNVVAKYVVSYALYQINYFGPNQTKDSMQMMERVAKSILKNHKGKFNPYGGNTEYNFHIIGTFGRAVEKNLKIYSQEDQHFAINALEIAKQDKDPEYYLYICENVGLLGTLVRPRKALEVIKHIMEDIELLEPPDDGRVESTFGDNETESVVKELKHSLAKVRVRFQREVDDFLIDVTDSRELYEQIRQIVPDYSIGEFYSWLFDELFYKMFIHYPDLADRVMTIFSEALNMKTAEKAMPYTISKILKLIVEWAKTDYQSP